jgi:hypothetical protein
LGGWNKHEWEGIRRQQWARGRGRGRGLNGIEKLVVMLELHVHTDLGDEDVLNWMRWVWEKCVSALRGGRCVHMGDGNGDRDEGPEVTVGGVRG